MKFHPKLLTVLLVFAVILIGIGPQVAAQDSDLESWAAGIKEKYAGTKVLAAVPSHPSTEAFKTMTPKFEEMTGIDVVLDEMEEGALGQKLLLEVSSGTTSYDTIMGYPEGLPFLVPNGYLEPLDDWLADTEQTPAWFDYEDILQAYRDMLSYEGKHYAIPFAGETVFVFYRKDLFEKYGVEVPKNFDELMETAAFFKDKEEGLAGVSFRARSGWEFTYTWSVFIFPFGGRMVDLDTREALLNKSETVQSLEYMAELAKYGPVGMESFSFPEAWDAFMLGKTAMMVEASAAAGEVENPDKSLVAGKVGYAPMPAGPDGAYSGVWGWGIAMTAGSQNKDAAWAFMLYLTGKATQEDYLANGGVVSRTSALTDPDKQAQYPYYEAILETLKQASDLQAAGLTVVLPIPEWSSISDVMGVEGSKALIGQQTAQEAAESMQAQVEDLLAGSS